MHHTSRSVVSLAALTLSCAGFALAGCCSDCCEECDECEVETTTASPMGSWRLVSIGGDAPTGAMDAAQGPSLVIGEDGTVSGYAGVNRFRGGGKYGSSAFEGGAFALGEIASTRMAGPPAANRLESRYIAALGAADAWTIDAEGTLLVTGSGEELRFERVEPTAE